MKRAILSVLVVVLMLAASPLRAQSGAFDKWWSSWKAMPEPAMPYTQKVAQAVARYDSRVRLQLLGREHGLGERWQPGNPHWDRAERLAGGVAEKLLRGEMSLGPATSPALAVPALEGELLKRLREQFAAMSATDRNDFVTLFGARTFQSMMVVGDLSTALGRLTMFELASVRSEAFKQEFEPLKREIMLQIEKAGPSLRALEDQKLKQRVTNSAALQRVGQIFTELEEKLAPPAETAAKAAVARLTEESKAVDAQVLAIIAEFKAQPR